MKKNCLNKNIKISVYVPNNFDFFCIILVIILNVIVTINILNQMKYTSRIFTFVMYAIVLTLLLFLIANKIKVYDKKFSYALFIVGLVQISRCFYLPSVDKTVLAMILLICSGVISILSSLHSYHKSEYREKYLESKARES